MKKIYFLLSVCLFVCVISANAQTPIIRKIEPIRQTTIITNPNITRQANKDTLPKLTRTPYRPIKIVLESFSSLHFAYDLGSIDKENFGWAFTKNATIEVTQNLKKNNWTKPFAWRRIPAGAAYGRWEISLLPFPINNFTRDFTGIIRSGIIETKGVDSIYFDIKYIDDANMPKRETTQNNNDKIQPLQQINIRNNPSSQPTTQGNVAILTPTNTIPTTADNTKSDELILTEVDNMALSKMQLFDNGTRKYYIRVVPLDASKNELSKISNAVALQEIKIKPLKAAPVVNYLSNDYTITAMKYVPIHFGEDAYVNCTIVTSYNKKETPDNAKQAQAFGFNDKDIFSLNQAQFDEFFQAAFPIGTVICPTPPKEKAWYEKAFNGTTGFITKAYDGAAKFYNKTKGYVKDKFKEINCNANLVTNVINPVTKVQEAVGKDVCEAICGAAFDYGMMAVGIPPSIPTSDEFVRLAEGQIVDIACDELESQTGLPVPDEAREALRKEFHNLVEAETKKGLISCGNFNVKPDPRGQFQTAYLEIEVTRTSDLFKGKGIVGCNVYNTTTNEATTSNYNGSNSKKVSLNGKLFEETSTKIPYIEKVGEKKTIYIVLKPQESYVHIDKDKGYWMNIGYSPQTGIYNSVIATDTYQSITNTPGFKALFLGETKFDFGLKVAQNLQLTFQNK